MRPSESHPANGLRYTGVLVLVLGIAAMLVHAGRYPPDLGPLSSAPAMTVELAKLVSMARVLAGLAVLNLAAWSFGGLVETLLKCPSRGGELRPLYRLGFGLAVLSVLVLAMAAVNALTRIAVIFAVVLPAIVPVLTWVRRPGRSPSASALRRVALPALAAGVLCFNAFLGAFYPDPGWDALTYHLGIPERYLFANGIVVTPFSQMSAYPFLVEMLFVPALVLGGSSLAVLVHLEFGILLLILVALSARRASGLAALLAPAILLSDSLFQKELSWAYNDLAFAFFALLAFTAFADWSSTSEPGLLRYAGVLGGISILVKVQGGTVTIVLLLMLWLVPRQPLRRRLTASVVLLSLALLVSSPWLARNLVFTGNPVAPLLQRFFRVGGTAYFDPTAIEQSAEFLSRAGMGKGLDDLLALPWNLALASTPGTYHRSFGYQVTPLYAIGAFAALGVASIRRRPDMAFLLRAGGILTLFWFFSLQEARFLIPALTCFAVAGGAALAALVQGLPRWGRLVLLLPLSGLLYGQALILKELPVRWGYALGSLSVERFEARHEAFAAAAELRRIMTPRDRVLLFGEGRSYCFRGLDYIPYHINEGPQVLQLLHRQKDPASLHRALRELGVTYLLVNERQLSYFRPVFVPSYREDDFRRDLALLRVFVQERTRTVYARNGMWVGVLLDTADSPP